MRDLARELIRQVAGLHARSLAPLVKARGFGMTPVWLRKSHHRIFS
jgi:hypothetical protein